MKTIRSLVTLSLLLLCKLSYTQTYQGFEGGLNTLLGNCWQFSSSIEMTSLDRKYTSITGDESMVTLPPVNEGVKDYIVTPYLDLSSSELTVAFNYMLSSKLAGSSYRLIKVGLIDKQNTITLLDSISLNKTSPTGVRSYERKFLLTS